MALTRASFRLGISIVEVLVALMLITVGLLGIAGSSAMTLRVAGDATRQRTAARRAADRIAALHAAGCAAAVGGSASDAAGTLRERWIVAAPAADRAEVVDSVVWSGPRGPRTLALASAIPC